MNLKKKIFVGSILLLLITTPTFVLATPVKENTHPLSLPTGYNSLGTVELKHQPLLGTYIKGVRGLDTHYFPPEGNPDYNYSFPKDGSGYIHLNFTLTVTHLYNEIPIYLAQHRFSGITIYINIPGIGDITIRDYNESKTTYFVSYNISVIFDTPILGNRSGRLYITAYPIPSLLAHLKPWRDICELFLCQPADIAVDTPISIIAIESG